MALRKGVLGLIGVVAAVGSMRAEPPVNPLVEGREPNPVVREFHEPEPAPFSYGGPVQPERSQGEEVSVPSWWELMMNHFTVPLGTVPTEGWQ
jgi:hypothetical protein